LEAVATKKETDGDDHLHGWSDDGPDPEEKSAEQRAIHASYEPLKKTEDNAMPTRKPTRSSGAASSRSSSNWHR
jgi:hypothetical protein